MNIPLTNQVHGLSSNSIEKISMDKAEAGPGETVTFTVKASDDLTGMSRMRLEYRSASGERLRHFSPKLATAYN